MVLHAVDSFLFWHLHNTLFSFPIIDFLHYIQQYGFWLMSKLERTNFVINYVRILNKLSETASAFSRSVHLDFSCFICYCLRTIKFVVLMLFVTQLCQVWEMEIMFNPSRHFMCLSQSRNLQSSECRCFMFKYYLFCIV